MFRDTNPAMLIVEDEPFIRMAAADIVSDIGVTAFEAADAGEALAILGDHPEIRLLFTDVNMPGMDGLDLVRIMKGDARIAGTVLLVLGSLGKPLDVGEQRALLLDGEEVRPVDETVGC
jgi:CheY-like chemotaxis protein